ncbi:hypothetical protein DM860_017750 [Cuscuta australis]|uniref:Uncharacterized protein n=1 Tax=Cuscuta australis TaxID=267555 RepID=A0A328DA53_9ASTE|nr:hypothetical protein DM860_017750 [Cuscuta australis]
MSEEIQNLKVHDGTSSQNMQRPTICLFVEHEYSEMSHSLYMFPLPLDLSDYDELIDSEGFMADSKYSSTVLTFSEKNRFLPYSASANLGSKIYFFGGNLGRVQGLSSDEEKRLAHQVQVFDTDDPEQGMRFVAPLNGPKQSPCVFVADGMIYALGTTLLDCEGTLPGCKGTGFFERYDPSSDHWEVLPDPPLPYYKWKGLELMGHATVVGRRVFIGGYLDLVFNLDTQDWDPRPPPELAALFCFGSLFVRDTASLYHLCGPNVWKPGTAYVFECYDGDSIQVIKRGPLTTNTATKGGDCDSSLLKDCSRASVKEQVMAEETELDENKFFTEFTFFPWRDIFHMGGRFFCYIVTAELVNRCDFTHEEPNSRGLWIKFFEEVPLHTENRNGGNCDKTRFRSLASFCYKIDTNFRSRSRHIRVSVLGTVPDSWINMPLKEKQETKLKHKIGKKSKVFDSQIGTSMQDRSLLMKIEGEGYKAEQSCPELKKTENTLNGDYNLKKLLTVLEEENSRLASELARKNELLKAYEMMLPKTGRA